MHYTPHGEFYFIHNWSAFQHKKIGYSNTSSDPLYTNIWISLQRIQEDIQFEHILCESVPN